MSQHTRPRAGDMIQPLDLRVLVMSDSDAKAALGRAAKFKGILKRRSKQLPVMLLLIIVLSIAMVYSLVTTVMM